MRSVPRRDRNGEVMPWVRKARSADCLRRWSLLQEAGEGLGKGAVVGTQIAVGLAHLVEGLIERVVSEKRVHLEWGPALMRTWFPYR